MALAMSAMRLRGAKLDDDARVFPGDLKSDFRTAWTLF